MAALRDDLFNVFPQLRAPKMKYHDVVPAGEKIQRTSEAPQPSTHVESRTQAGTDKPRDGRLECDQSHGRVSKDDKNVDVLQ